MLLVTDEDRDDTIAISDTAVLDILKAGGWSLHAILNQEIIPEESIGVRQEGASNWIVYGPAEDPSTETNYTETASNTLPLGEGCCVDEFTPIPEGVVDYYPLAFETAGAVWNINKLRAGGFVAEIFTEAFIAITTEAFAPEPTGDEECPFTGLLFFLCIFWWIWTVFLSLFGL